MWLCVTELSGVLSHGGLMVVSWWSGLMWSHGGLVSCGLMVVWSHVVSWWSGLTVVSWCWFCVVLSCVWSLLCWFRGSKLCLVSFVLVPWF